MALYRGDPVLESLRDVGNSLRTVTGDVLQRRRLDIEEQGVLGRQEQERNLQQLRTQAATATGETSLLQARGDVAMKQQGMELARKAEGRAEEMHPLQMSAAQAGIEAQRFQVEEGRTLLPEKVRTMRAQASHAAASAEHERMRAKLTAAEYKAATAPVNLPNIVGMLNATGNEPMANIIMGAYPPGAQPNQLDLHRQLTLMNQFFPQGMGQIKLGTLDQQLKEETDPQKRVALREERNNTLINMGRNPRDDLEGLQASIVSRAMELPKITDPDKRRQVSQEIDDLMRVAQGMTLKGKPQPTNLREYLEQSKLSPDTLQKVMQSASVGLGHTFLGDEEDYLIESGGITPKPGYITPNQLYARVGNMVKPASPDEMSVYQKGGTLANGKVLEANPNIKTQAQADAYKRELFVQEKHTQTGGDIRRLEAMMQATNAPPPAPTAPPPPTPQRATSPFGARTAQVQEEVTAQLRQALGREPTPEEVAARLKQLGSPGFVPGGGSSLLGAVRKFANEQNLTPALTPEDRLRRLREHQERTGIPATGANDLQDR